MQLYEMQVSKTAIYRTAPVRIPRGIVGAAVKLSFSPEWEGLTKTVVFRAGEITKDILDVKDVAVIPSECTETAGALLEIGVYGVDAENTVAIPTLWAAIGRVSEAADPSGDATTDPQLPVWAQLQAQIDQLERQGITQNEIEQAVRDFFGGERPTGKTTPQGGEIFNDYENNQAIAPYAKADGYGSRAGIHGYKLLAVEKNGENYNITVGDAKLDSKALNQYAAGDLLCVDGQGHFYDCLRITAITTNGDGNSVITVAPTDSRDLSKLAVDSSQDEWENWVYVLEKPDAGEPVKAAFGAYAGGVGSVAIGYGAFAHGADNQSIGKYAYTAGRENVAHYAGYAKGRNNKALGENSSAEGYGNTVTGMNAHADGANNIVTGKSAHAHNGGNTASGLYSSASGFKNTASGETSEAGGNGTTASGKYSFTRGYQTEASGAIAAAFGRGAKAKGYGAFAEGRDTVAAGQYQHVQGKYNVEDASLAHIVGGGSSDTNRKNIYTLDWQGNAEFAGKVYSGGVEVAPGGFGLGREEGYIVTDLDDAKVNGWFYWGDGTLHVPPLIYNSTYGAGFVISRTAQDFTQFVVAGSAVTFQTTLAAMRSYANGIYGEWEYINPPMLPGVEYHTTERSNGNVVYAKRITCTVAEDIGGSGVVDIYFSHGIVGKAYNVRIIGWCIKRPLPLLSETGGMITIDTVYDDAIVLRTFDSSLAANTNFVFDMYYTKS